MYMLAHACLLRGGDVRQLELSDLYILDIMEDSGTLKTTAFCMVLKSGKFSFSVSLLLTVEIRQDKHFW